MTARAEARPLEIQFSVSPDAGKVSALLLRSDAARELCVLAHGAGAGMRHPFMDAMARRLAEQGMATLRYQFPYMEHGSKRPDPPRVLTATVRAAIAAAAQHAGDLPRIAGGKSMGGRMTTTAASEDTLDGVRGIVLFGFPLHPPGRPGDSRAAHLEQVEIPMLFLQGTRDTLADLDLLRPVCASLGARVTLHVIDGGDHSFHVLKRSGRDDSAVLDDLARTTTDWARQLHDPAKK